MSPRGWKWIFSKMGLAEGGSTGIPKIRHFMQRNGSPKPVFQTDKDLNYFLVTLYPHPLMEKVTQ